MTLRPASILPPTARPTGEVSVDDKTDWIALRDALAIVMTIMPDRRTAERWLMQHAMLGEVPISCRTLRYERADAGPRTHQQYQYPGADARLAEQLLTAHGDPRARFRCNAIEGTITWADVGGAYAVNAIMLEAQVGRDAILERFAERVSAQGHTPRKPYNGHSAWEDLVAWYKARIEGAGPAGYTRAEDEEAGKVVGIGRDRVRELRNELKPESWPQSGAPSKHGGAK